jgi:hypothetical protein
VATSACVPGGVGNARNPGQRLEPLYADATERPFGVYDDDTLVTPVTTRPWERSGRTSRSGARKVGDADSSQPQVGHTGTE